MKRKIWTDFLLANISWIIVSLVLAFGFWMLAVLQSDPIQQREFTRDLPIRFLLDENMILIDDAEEMDATVTVRAPRSVWEGLSADQIRITADLRESNGGVERVELQGELQEGLRGEVVQVRPETLEVEIQEVAAQRVPIEPVVTQDPPSGYTYPTPTCALAEVTARGPATLLNSISAVARLNLSEVRNPVSLTATLYPTDSNGRIINDVSLEPTEVECQVEITQQTGVSELSVVPAIEGFPPDGYIYEGYDFNPKTVVVNGLPSAVRELNGVVSTEPINLANVTSSFEQTVQVLLPPGVRLQDEAQSITVRVNIGTIPGSRQFSDVPVIVEGLGADLDAEVLPNRVTIFVVGPQPLLAGMNETDLRAVVNVQGLSAGTYQQTATASLLLSGSDQNMQVNVQPSSITVTITSSLPTPILEPGAPTPTPSYDIR